MANLKQDKPKKASDKGLSSKIKDFESIKAYYELSDEHLTPSLILHKIAETIELYLKIVQQILQPEEFHAIYECNAFGDDDKTQLFDLYKRLIMIHRSILIAIVSGDEKGSIETIQEAHKSLSGMKPQIISLLKRMKDSWNLAPSKDIKSSSAHYFG